MLTNLLSLTSSSLFHLIQEYGDPFDESKLKLIDIELFVVKHSLRSYRNGPPKGSIIPASIEVKGAQMSSIADRFRPEISLEYSLIDRMRVRGHVMTMQSITQLRTYFQQVRGVNWIEKRHLERVTADFVQHVEAFAEKNGIPILFARPGESHVEKAAEYLDTVTDRDEGVYCIIKVQEDTSSFVSYVPKKGDDKTRKIARGRRRINNYYFFVKDRDFGVGNSIRIATYAPFTVTACFNGHNFVAQYLRNRQVEFEMRDNLFVSVHDVKVFRWALRALTHQAITKFCERWVYRCINLFPAWARRQGFRYRWFLDQVERCHNLIFSSQDRLNSLFARLLDSGRAIGQPHVIARLFQRRLQAKRTGGRMQRTRQEDYCLKAWHKKTYIKQYNKQGFGLRTETSTHDVREFGLKKNLWNLPHLLHCMDNCNKRLLRWQDTIDQTTVSSRFLEKLGQPTVPENGRRVPGLKLDNPRLYLVLSAVLQFAHLITGFRSKELRTYLQGRFGLSPDDYTAAQLRYDLLKLRGKGLVRKLSGSARYVLTAKGITQGTALLKLNECLNGSIGETLPGPRTVPSPQTELQKGYRRVRAALQSLLGIVGLIAA